MESVFSKDIDKYEAGVFSGLEKGMSGSIKKGDVVKVDTTKKIFFNVKQLWKSAKAVETENKERETTGDNVGNKKKN